MEILANLNQSLVEDGLKLLEIELNSAIPEFHNNKWTMVHIVLGVGYDALALKLVLSHMAIFHNLPVLFNPHPYPRIEAFLPSENTFSIIMAINISTAFYDRYYTKLIFNSSYSKVIESNPLNRNKKEYVTLNTVNSLQFSEPLNVYVYSDKQSSVRKINKTHFRIWGLKRALLTDLEGFLKAPIKYRVIPYGADSAEKVNISIKCLAEKVITSHLQNENKIA